MSFRSIAASVFIATYLTAAISVAVPSPAELALVTGERYSQDDRVARHVRPHLDRLQRPFEAASRLAWVSLRAPHRLLAPAVSRLGLSQRWRMFAQPPRVNTTIAVRVVGVRPDGTPVTTSAVVAPRLGESAFKGLSAYQAGFADKAVSNAFDAWNEMKARGPSSPDDAPTKFGRDVLAPVGRHFGRDVIATLPSTTRILRVELWQGYAPMPRRGQGPNASKPPLSELPLDAELGTSVRNGAARWTLRRVDQPGR